MTGWKHNILLGNTGEPDVAQYGTFFTVDLPRVFFLVASSTTDRTNQDATAWCTLVRIVGQWTQSTCCHGNNGDMRGNTIKSFNLSLS